jgi:hypothetical protein
LVNAEGVETLGEPASHRGAAIVVVDVEGGRAPRPPPPPHRGHPHECRQEACLDPSVAIQSPRCQLNQ